MSNIRKDLVEIAENQLPNNTLAKVIAYYYPLLTVNKTHKEFFDSLFNYYQNYDPENIKSIERLNDSDEEVSEEKLQNFMNKDFRIKNFEIANIRGIPEKEQGVPYGMDFMDEMDNIQNAVILGPNGTGKSSLFSALEMIYAQEISENKIRGSNIDNYLERVDGIDSAEECSIETEEGNFDLNNKFIGDRKVLEVINPQSHFISEYKLYKHGQLKFDADLTDENSFHYLIASNLGLNEYLKLVGIVQDLSKYNRKKERNELNRKIEEKNENLKTLENLKSKREENQKQLNELKSNSEKSSLNKEEENNLKLLEKIEKKNLQVGVSVKEFEFKIRNFKESFLNGIDTEGKTTEITFLRTGLNLIDHYNNCPFCQASKKNEKVIKNEIEKRLERFQNKEEQFNEIINAYVEALRETKNAFKELSNFVQIFNAEHNDLLYFKELEEVAKKAERIALNVGPITDDEEMYNFLNSFNENHIVSKNEIQKFFDFLEENSQLISLASTYLVEIDEILKERNKVIKSIRSELESGDTSSIEKQINSLKNEIEYQKHSEEEIQKKANELGEVINYLEETQKTIEKIKVEAKEVVSHLETHINYILEERFNPIKHLITKIIDEYLQEENAKLEIFSEGKPKDNEYNNSFQKVITAKIIKEDPNSKIPIYAKPNQFFNNFRYRLFCFMISLSLALANRIRYKINLPLVIDDLFYSSDYQNKASFSRFLTNVLSIFQRFSSDIPLQLILFTHDDMIFRSAMDAIDDVKIKDESGIHPRNKTIFARLFAPEPKNKDFGKFKSNNKDFISLIYELNLNSIFQNSFVPSK